jgi:hypothetical protein
MTKIELEALVAQLHAKVAELEAAKAKPKGTRAKLPTWHGHSQCSLAQTLGTWGVAPSDAQLILLRLTATDAFKAVGLTDEAVSAVFTVIEENMPGPAISSQVRAGKLHAEKPDHKDAKAGAALTAEEANEIRRLCGLAPLEVVGPVLPTVAA